MKTFLFVVVLLMSAAASAAPRLSVDRFFRHPEFRGIRLSPDGKYIAVVTPKGDQESLVVIQRDGMKPLSSMPLGENRVVAQFRWVSKDRLIVSPAKKIGALDTPVGTGELYAVNADGSKKIQLLGPTLKGEQFTYAFDIERVFNDDRDRIIITKIDSSSTYLSSYWLNIYTGNLTRIGRSPVAQGSLAFDREGKPRLAFGSNDQGESIVLYREQADSDWKEISRGKMEDARLTPIAFSADGKKLFAQSDRGRKTTALVSYDPGTQQQEVLLADPISDVNDVLYDRSGEQVIGVRVEPDYPKTLFLDEQHPDARIYRALEKTFRGASVHISSFTRDGSLATVIVSSDKEPGAYYLLETTSMRMSPMLRVMPWVEPAQMADREAVQIKARDGLDLRGYLTLPKGRDKNLPLILLVHGGPHGPRDSWQFDPEAQFLATRGYAVLQMNYRGSGGYGREFMRAGFQKWGNLMQDDLTDAVQWAIREGIADRQRVCIAGASYGGYAALMSPIREPDLYKCAFAFVGVYDLALMFEKGDIPQTESGQAYLRRALGSDPAQWKAQSPVHQLDTLKAALFIAHGEKDVRAHIKHFEVLREALDKRGYAYEWLTKPKEAHGFYDEQNRFELYSKVAAFFDRHIGERVPAGTAGSGARR